MIYSDYIVYVDESGDHNLDNPDPAYPVFVLAFCIFEKTAYTEVAVPALQRLKFKHFGHDMVILHERDIRKSKGAFRILQVEEIRNKLMHDLDRLVEDAPFTLIAVVIDKEKHRTRYIDPVNPYTLAMAFGLERVDACLSRKGAKA